MYVDNQFAFHDFQYIKLFYFVSRSLRILRCLQKLREALFTLQCPATAVAGHYFAKLFVIYLCL